MQKTMVLGLHDYACAWGNTALGIVYVSQPIRDKMVCLDL